MIQHIQTVLHSEAANGDCWATSIECILDLPLGTLPRWAKDQAGSFYRQNVLVYLAYHHGVWSQRIDASAFGQASVRGYHIINGDSPRFAGFGHSVVGMDGLLRHDPHPDGTFVTRVTEWELFVPIPEDARSWYYYLTRIACPCGCTDATINEWWAGLTGTQARKVMRARATSEEIERIQSERAARTWWRSLGSARRAEVWGARDVNL